MLIHAPISPADATNPVEEPREVEEFLTLMQLTCMPNPHTCLSEITHFAAISSESIEELTDRFEELSFPLLNAGIMTTRGLAVLLHRHLPIHIRAATISAMQLEDERRMKTGEDLINLGELLLLVHTKEDNLLRFERRYAKWDSGPTTGLQKWSSPTPANRQPIKERLLLSKHHHN